MSYNYIMSETVTEPTTITEPTDAEKAAVNPVSDTEAEYNKLKEKNNQIQEELLRTEKLKSEILLGGETGGHISPKEVSPEEQKKMGAKEFFKGTSLEGAIEKL